jgi:hypothetical protein
MAGAAHKFIAAYAAPTGANAPVHAISHAVAVDTARPIPRSLLA